MGLKKRLVLEKMPRVVIVIQAVPVAWADKAFLAPEPDLYACTEMVAARHAARDG